MRKQNINVRGVYFLQVGIMTDTVSRKRRLGWPTGALSQRLANGRHLIQPDEVEVILITLYNFWDVQ